MGVFWSFLKKWRIIEGYKFEYVVFMVVFVGLVVILGEFRS